MTQRLRAVLSAMTLLFAFGLFAACSTPERSQRFFRTAVETDPVIEPVYSTSLYTVYYDHALRRCVVHASYVFGQEGSGGGGAGLGISVYKCDPDQIRDRARALGATVFRAQRPAIVEEETPALSPDATRPLPATHPGGQP